MSEQRISAKIGHCSVCDAPLMIKNGIVERDPRIGLLLLGGTVGDPMPTIVPHYDTCPDFPDLSTAPTSTVTASDLVGVHRESPRPNP